MPSHVLLALLLAASPSAPTTAEAPPPVEYEILAGGTAIGSETVVRNATADGTTLAGTIRLAFPGGAEGTLQQDLALAPDGRPLKYALEIEAPGQQFVVKAVPDATGYVLSIFPRGADTPLKTQNAPVKPPVFLLDNNFASHLDVLTRTLGDLPVGGERAIAALVPQTLLALPANVQRGADGRGAISGAPVATRTYAVTIANVREEVVADARDGSLLQIAVPLQQLQIRRKGFAAATAPVAAADADPRESSTELASAAGALPATLLVPKAERPLPGVVFLAGSGPNDRDETIGPNKPFADIARGLGDRGIASFRFDKRTHVVKDPAQLATITLKEEYYDDAAKAIARLRATPGIDPKRIYVVGHSEGAMVAPKIAAADPDVRGVVLMAAGVRPIDVMIVDQMEFGAKLTGRTDLDIKEQTDELQSIFAAIRDPERKNTPPFMGAPASYWREVIALDVPAMVASAKVPILVLQGDKDIQVRKDLDFDVLRAKVGAAGGRVTYKSFPDLNHLFMKVTHPSTGAEYALPGHVDAAVIAAISDWILAH